MIQMNPDIFRAMLKFAVQQARAITDDQEALEVKCLYKQWEKQIGRNVQVGEYLQHNDKLYRVLQEHVVTEQWVPGVGTESLYVVIDKTHAGTLDDPIPWCTNMECFEGKYYIEEGILYLCIRDSGIALHTSIKEVLANYFEQVIENQEPEVEEPNEEEPKEEEPEVEEPKEEESEVETWIQPGATNPYMKGDIVLHNNALWICDIDNNVWEPGAYGWSIHQ